MWAENCVLNYVKSRSHWSDKYKVDYDQDELCQVAEKYKVSLIYGMIQRLQKIVSPEYIKDYLAKLKKAFENSGYPDSVLRKHYRTNTKIRKNPITQDQSPNKTIYFGLTSTGGNSDVFSRRVRKICSNAFPSIKVRQIYKSAPNLLGAFSSQYKPKCSLTAIGVYKIKCKVLKSLHRWNR